MQNLLTKVSSIGLLLRAARNDSPPEIEKKSLDQPMACLFDTSFAYSVNVQKDKEFISHCGPGEWVVCNCITEGGNYVRVDQVENNLEPEDTDELTKPLDNE